MLEWLIVFNIFFYKESTLIKKRGMIIIVKVNYFNQLVRHENASSFFFLI